MLFIIEIAVAIALGLLIFHKPLHVASALLFVGLRVLIFGAIVVGAAFLHDPNIPNVVGIIVIAGVVLAIDAVVGVIRIVSLPKLKDMLPPSLPQQQPTAAKPYSRFSEYDRIVAQNSVDLTARRKREGWTDY